jgi:hypothetical protein
MFLSPKLDTLQKKFGCHKIIFATIDVGKLYYNKDATHNKNERTYIGRGRIFFFDIVQFGSHASSK